MQPRRIALCAVALAIASSAAGQSLGDIAKQEEERRRKITASGKVYTHEREFLGNLRRSGIAWTPGGYTAFAWQEAWASRSEIDNSTTVTCRALWSDINHNSTTIENAMDEVSEIARRRGVLPGIMRDLYTRYRLTAWVQ